MLILNFFFYFCIDNFFINLILCYMKTGLLKISARVGFFKQRLKMFENLAKSELMHSYTVCTIRIKSLCFCLNVSGVPSFLKEDYNVILSYDLTVQLYSSVFTTSFGSRELPFALDLFKVYLSKCQLVSVFCLLAKLDRLILK